MFVQDGKRRIQRIWGGYSPKIFDGNFLELFRDELEEKFNGAGIVADTHFEWGKNNFEHVDFFVPFKNPSSRNQDPDGVNISKLTKEQMSYNTAIHKLRARVEDTFGEIKSDFKALKTPWRESEDQLDCLVWIAAGIHNSRI